MGLDKLQSNLFLHMHTHAVHTHTPPQTGVSADQDIASQMRLACITPVISLLYSAKYLSAFAAMDPSDIHRKDLQEQ